MRRILCFVLALGACAKAGEGQSRYDFPGGVGGAAAVGPATTGSGAGTCLDGRIECGDACVDPLQDPAHCGGCDQPCNPGDDCVQGQCVGAPNSTVGASTGVTVGASSSVGVASTSVAAVTSVAASSSSSGGGGGGGCDPKAPSVVCGKGKHCVPAPDGKAACQGPIGFGQQYASCFASSDCDAALECVTTPYASTYCLKWCTSDLDCSGLDVCTALNPPLYAGPVEYGLCYDGYP